MEFHSGLCVVQQNWGEKKLKRKKMNFVNLNKNDNLAPFFKKTTFKFNHLTVTQRPLCITADNFSCHKSTGVTNTINDCSTQFKQVSSHYSCH